MPQRAKKLLGSPVRHVDPVVRALNTVMYGMVIHFATMLMVPQEESCDDSRETPVWVTMLLLHEYWIYLQHCNVLANPLCQRLDRQYGIALLKSNQHWAIAGTLSAYWCRETFSMFLCLPFLRERFTQYLVLYSIIYHTIKSRGVRQDALRRYSPTFGIMRVVIDNFYLHTTPEKIVTVVRLLLQGFDTWIHFKIVAGMLPTLDISIMTVHKLFAVWVAHAAMNQFFRCSTASIMVHAWHWMTTKVTVFPKTGIVEESFNDESTGSQLTETSDDDTAAESLSSREDDTEQDYVVRNLLREGRVPDELKGRKGAASGGVDSAVKVETLLAILSTVYVLGMGDVPFRILALGALRPINIDRTTISYAWLLWYVLQALSVLLLSNKQPKKRERARRNLRRKKALLNIADVSMLLTCVSIAETESRSRLLATGLAAGLTAKSFLHSAPEKKAPVFWIAINILEFGSKLVLLRWIEYESDTAMASIGALVCALWSLGTLQTRMFDRNPEKSSGTTEVADIVFLGHPAELHDCWALWMLPYSLEERWKRPWWAVPLWPLHYLVGYFVCNWRQRLLGDGASFFNCDDVTYEGVRMQTWTAAHFGRHFFTHPRAVKRNIEAAARHADDTGVKVLCLGALNKAESINGGGVGVVRALGSHRNISVIHGNHLTAAAVVETTKQVFGNKARVFLTGASSKVGWAVARALRDRFDYEVLCHSTDSSRRQLFKENGFQAASSLEEGMAFSDLWIVGKYDMAVAASMPQGGTAVVFAVPHPLGGRKDIRVIEAGTLHMDLSRLDRPRRFSNKLKSHEVFACHAAGVVAAYRLKHCGLERFNETGPVDPDKMDSWMEDAKKLGFRVPYAAPVDSFGQLSSGAPRVVVIGAGPSGLAVAASLRRRGIQSTILEGQTNSESFGSWDKHFSGLEVTTQKRWCNLPGFAMNDKEFPGENVSASEFKRYLSSYAKRFGLDIKRGRHVKKIVRGGDSAPWIVECEDEKFLATSVVVATGKNNTPQRDTSDGLRTSLVNAGINTIHSSDLKDEKTWSEAINAAQQGKLCVVGFGNSAADICTAVLSSCSPTKGLSRIHVAARTVPPVFPRKRGCFRVDSIGFAVRWLPRVFQEPLIRLLWSVLPSSAACDSAFPAHLPRWSQINGRVPVIDKYDQISSAFGSGLMVGHGPIQKVLDEQKLVFEDGAGKTGGTHLPIEMAILATGYKADCIVAREDRLNGLYRCGFRNERLLPLKSIGEEAEAIARELAENQ